MTVSRRGAGVIYRLAEAVARFRRAAEWAYVESGPALAATERRGMPPPPVPSTVGECLGLLREYATLSPDEFPTAGGLPAAATRLIDAGDGVWARLGDAWLDDNHLSRLRAHDAAVSGCDNDPSYWAAQMLAGSPIGSGEWQEYSAAAQAVEAALPAAAQSVFSLGRELAEIAFPALSSYDPGGGGLPVSDPVILRGTVGPRVTRLIRRVRDSSSLLHDLPDRFEGVDALPAAIDLHRRILTCLTAVPQPHESDPQGSTVPTGRSPDERIPAQPVGPNVPQLPTVPVLEANESLAELVAAKDRVDPENRHVGRSLALLRTFRRIEDLNRLADDPVVLLGPSGVGKTHLAELVHRSSARRSGPFLNLAADELTGGDASLRRDRLLGHGRNSGVSGLPASHAEPGLLRRTAGGTIFIDELHSLDRATLDLLRRPMDRGPLHPATGEGQAFTPDVRFVFATYRRLDELLAERVLPVDFHRRLGDRTVEVPSLDQRREDVPLFVERFRDGRRPRPCFLLALLYHDWHLGQVDELLRAIRDAISRRREGEAVTAADLSGVLPTRVLDSVRSLPEEVRERELYMWMCRTLRAQGFKSGRGLQNRMAELLNVCPSAVSQRRAWFAEGQPNAGNTDPSTSIALQD